MSKRAELFEDIDFDVSGFEPKKDQPAKSASDEEVRAVAEAASFRSREPVAPKKKEAAKPEIGRYRTGRNVGMNTKVTRECQEKLHRIADANNWVLGETIELALDALERELGRQGAG